MISTAVRIRSMRITFLQQSPIGRHGRGSGFERKFRTTSEYMFDTSTPL
jgi:hypothetical protein